MCGDYYIGGREFDTLSDLIGYYTSWSDLLKGERLQHPVPPPEVGFLSSSSTSVFHPCEPLVLSPTWYLVPLGT